MSAPELKLPDDWQRPLSGWEGAAWLAWCDSPEGKEETRRMVDKLRAENGSILPPYMQPLPRWP